VCELYLDDGHEVADLCLGLAEAGADTWYVPDVQAHVLERNSRPDTATAASRAFDEWLFDLRWGRRLVGTAAAEDSVLLRRLPVPLALGPEREPGSTPLVELLDVIAAEPDASWLREASLLEPQAAQATRRTRAYSFVIEGWAVPADGRPVTVELRDGSIVRSRMLADRPRHELASKYPDEPGAPAAGFRFVVDSAALPAQFELKVMAVSEHGPDVPLGKIRGRRRPLPSGYSPSRES
jgi:hypothetical protein